MSDAPIFINGRRGASPCHIVATYSSLACAVDRWLCVGFSVLTANNIENWIYLWMGEVKFGKYAKQQRILFSSIFLDSVDIVCALKGAANAKAFDTENLQIGRKVSHVQRRQAWARRSLK